ncbi:MAG: aminotransferase, partial [Alphaproteobacteria bacterium]
YTLDSLTFCQKMLVETGIAATPGLDFDPTRGHEYIRFSYCGDTSTIETACDKLADWLLAQPRLKDEK